MPVNDKRQQLFSAIAFGAGRLLAVETCTAVLRHRRLVLVWNNCPLEGACNVLGQVVTLSGPVDCTGDCNRDGRVTVDEVVRAVRIDLNSYEFPTSRCLPADPSLDYEVSVGELLQAVGHALDGCP